MEEHDRQRADERHLFRLTGRLARGGAFSHHPGDCVWIEEACVRDGCRIEQLTDVLGCVRACESGGDGRAVRDLAPLRDLRRKQGCHRLSQNVLLLKATQPQVVGEAGGELCDAIVEEREPALDRETHEHAVGLGVEQVRRQERRDLQILGLGQRCPARERPGQARADALARVALRSSARNDLRGQEPDAAGGVCEAEGVAVQRIVRLRQAAAVEAREKGAGTTEILAEILVQAGKEERPQLRVRLPCPEPTDLRLAEDVVSGKQLVRPFPREHDLQAGSVDRGGQPQQRRRRRTKSRLLRELDGARQQLSDVRRVDRHPRQAGAELLGEAVLVHALVEARIAKPDPERGETRGRKAARERRGRGRVEPAADVGSNRHIRSQPQARGVAKQLEQLLVLVAAGGAASPAGGNGRSHQRRSSIIPSGPMRR